jgi:hypothetical protein
MAMNYNNLTPAYDYRKQLALMQAMNQIADGGNMPPNPRSLPQRLMQPNPNITRDTLDTLIPKGMQGLGRIGGMVRNALPDNMQRMLPLPPRYQQPMQGLGRVVGGMVRNALPDNMQRMPLKRQGGVMRNTPQPNYRMFQR